jgi:hypothetical protein
MGASEAIIDAVRNSEIPASRNIDRRKNLCEGTSLVRVDNADW